MNSTTQFDSIMECYKTIDEILTEVGVKEPATIYICTNSVDKRLIYLLRYFQQNNLLFNTSQKTRLSKCLGNFVKNLDTNNCYFIPNSGKYELLIQKHDLMDIIRYFRV